MKRWRTRVVALAALVGAMFTLSVLAQIGITRDAPGQAIADSVAGFAPALTMAALVVGCLACVAVAIAAIVYLIYPGED